MFRYDLTGHCANHCQANSGLHEWQSMVSTSHALFSSLKGDSVTDSCPNMADPTVWFVVFHLKRVRRIRWHCHPPRLVSSRLVSHDTLLSGRVRTDPPCWWRCRVVQSLSMYVVTAVDFVPSWTDTHTLSLSHTQHQFSNPA